MHAWYGLALVATLSACIVDEKDGWIPADVDIDATLEKVGEETQKLVCNQFEGSVHRIYRSPLLIKAACTAHVVPRSRNAEECAVLTEQCLDTLPPVVDRQLENVLQQAGCRAIGLPRRGCKSTVSELISCLGDLGDAVAGVQLEATCAAFGKPVPEDWWHIATPVSCFDLFAHCQGPKRKS